MSEAEQTALEQEYFADSQLFDQIVEAESNLLDQYARGRLSPETRRRYEQHYLVHPKRRERSKFAETLAGRIDRAGEMLPSLVRPESRYSRLSTALQGPKLAWALSLALIVLIIGFALLAIQTRRLHQELTRNEAERIAREGRERNLQEQLADERRHADLLGAELDPLRSEENARQTPTPSNHTARTLATLVLNITGVRGTESGATARLVISPQTEQARIQLHLSDNDYQRYSIVIQSADDKQIVTRDSLKASKRSATLFVIVPASKLPNGDYVLTLKGFTQGGEVEDISKSIFHVSRSQPR